MQPALEATSGVISAAGITLAATFAALTVMTTLLYLARIGRIVAVGVPVDTLFVRLFLVPALILDLGLPHLVAHPTVRRP
ncbi:MMPL family transporter [Streptomyces roseus]|uniref:MMPL family transporter n=1 Tax=Streptomyces roseus TaxID=66430 RepID=UPI0037FBAE13